MREHGFFSLIKRPRYVYKLIRKNWRDKYFLKFLIVKYIVGSYYKFIPNKGTFVMEEDWDNLIILDACRYDLFTRVTNEDCEYKISRGSSTPEFLLENFSDKRYNETVYITANPQVDKHIKNSFLRIISVWKTNWHDELRTVLPEVMVDKAIRYEEKYPDKRLIIHFLQPHRPFIEDPELNDICFGERSAFGIIENIEGDKTGRIYSNPWKEVGRGNLDLERVYNAYERNLKLVLPHAFKLANELKGKTVITSDHGQAINDWAYPFPIKILDHPSGIHIPALVQVPWFVIEGKNRKNIKQGNKKQSLSEQIRKKKSELKI